MLKPLPWKIKKGGPLSPVAVKSVESQCRQIYSLTWVEKIKLEIDDSLLLINGFRPISRKITQSTVPNHNSDIFKAKKGVTILGNVTIMSGHSNCYWGLKDVRHITYRARLSQNKIIFDRSLTSGSNRNSLYKSRCS